MRGAADGLDGVGLNVPLGLAPPKLPCLLIDGEVVLGVVWYVELLLVLFGAILRSDGLFLSNPTLLPPLSFRGLTEPLLWSFRGLALSYLLCLLPKPLSWNRGLTFPW